MTKCKGQHCNRELGDKHNTKDGYCSSLCEYWHQYRFTNLPCLLDGCDRIGDKMTDDYCSWGCRGRDYKNILKEEMDEYYKSLCEN